MRKTISIALLIPLVASCGYKAPPNPTAPLAAAASPSVPDPRLIYDLREKCRREGSDWFKQFYGDGEEGGAHSSYTNHYNERRNRCYAVVITYIFFDDKNTRKIQMSDQRTLVDVSENRDIGAYFKFDYMPGPMSCKVVEDKCSSEEGWGSAVASYMEQ